MLSARELKAESQNFSQSKTPNVRLAAALTSEAKNRETKMTKMTKEKIYQKNTTRSETRYGLVQVVLRKTQKNITTKGQSGPCVIKKTKWSTKQGSKCIPKYSDTTWYERKNSINGREKPPTRLKKRGGGVN